MNVKELVDTLKKADLSKVAYDKILAVINLNEIRIPYTTAMIRTGVIIERGRINNQKDIFNSEFEISYRTDTGNIKEFGRANKPYQSRFYGSMPSPEIKMPTIVLFSELVEQFNERTLSDYDVTMTIGRWFVKEDFEVADICFSENYFEVGDLKNRFDYWIEKTKDTDLNNEDFKNLLFFFSNEFSKTHLKSHFDYKLSCLYTDIAIYMNKLNGVSYPSVKTDYKANNIVLDPRAVEKYLELREVAVFRFIIENKKPLVIQTHYSDKLGPLNSSFVWKQYIQ